MRMHPAAAPRGSALLEVPYMGAFPHVDTFGQRIRKITISIRS
jgi:hypothetical protein